MICWRVDWVWGVAVTGRADRGGRPRELGVRLPVQPMVAGETAELVRQVARLRGVSANSVVAEVLDVWHRRMTGEPGCKGGGSAWVRSGVRALCGVCGVSAEALACGPGGRGDGVPPHVPRQPV